MESKICNFSASTKPSRLGKRIYGDVIQRQDECRKLAQVLVLIGAVWICFVCGCRQRAPQPDDGRQPGRISGASMAPNFLGEHYEATCADCQFPFSIDVHQLPLKGEMVCPNCGFDQSPIPSEAFAGQPVLIDSDAYTTSRPSRFDVVAFRQGSGASNDTKIKRVIGLPGETVEIRSGELWVNGKLIRKDLDLQQKMAILVHDQNYLPSSDVRRRWHTSNRLNGSLVPIRKNNLEISDSGVHKFQYRHQRSYYAVSHPSPNAVIEDYYSYNQTLSRNLQAVTDLAIGFDIQLNSAKRLSVTIGSTYSGNRRSDVQVRLNFSDSRVDCLREGRVIGREKLKIENDKNHQLYFSNIDRQILLSIGTQVFQFPSTQPSEPNSDTPTVKENHIELEGTGKSMVISNVRLFRDIYYFNRQYDGRTWSATCGEDEYLVIGDNIPVSKDSRDWEKPTISLNQILGRVLPISK